MTEADRSAEALAEQRLKEAYFTASQTQLIWARFRKNRSAMVAGAVLILLILMGLGAPFLSPYEPTIAGRDKDYQFGAPQIPMFCDHNGCSLRPFLHTLERTRSIETNFRWVTEVNTEKRRYVHFFVPGWKYRIFAIELDLPGKAFDIRTRGLEFETHLFGVDEGGIHIFGTDSAGKDIFSRTLHAIWTSLAVGTIGMLIGFVLALLVGGVSGYFGGHIDGASRWSPTRSAPCRRSRSSWRSRLSCPTSGAPRRDSSSSRSFSAWSAGPLSPAESVPIS